MSACCGPDRQTTGGGACEDANPEDGEGPVRTVTVRRFATFVKATGDVTETERSSRQSPSVNPAALPAPGSIFKHVRRVSLTVVPDEAAVLATMLAANVPRRDDRDRRAGERTHRLRPPTRRRSRHHHGRGSR